MVAVLAVDLGATSVRVCRIELDAQPPNVEVIHRYAHGPAAAADGTLRWDWARIVSEVERGLASGTQRGPVASIGVDAWGVDYGLLGEDGSLLSPPYSYRDRRTSGWRQVVDRIGEDTLYRTAGIQLMEINTIFQLAAHPRDELDRAAQLVMLPELMVDALTGGEAGALGERSSASTTGLVELDTGTWAPGLLDAIGINPSLVPPIRDATTPGGVWRGVPVHLVGGHDTASAVVALPGPPRPGAAFVSTGTWILAGCERNGPDTSEAARAAKFSNEGGALGGVRFLKNVNGMWILEQCRHLWGDPPVEELVHAAVDAGPAPAHTFDATDARFLAPSDMEAEVRSAAKLSPGASRAEVVRCILESLAVTTATVLDELSTLTGDRVTEVHVLGGASRIALLNQLLEDACEVPVRVGPSSGEATALGNALVQGIAIGRFATLDDARRAIAEPAEPR